MTSPELSDPPVAPPPPPDDAGEPEQWRTNRAGKQFVTARGRSGLIVRKGDETVAQARAADLERMRAQGRKPPEPGGPTAPADEPERDRRPKRKSKRPPMPDAPRTVDLKELEATLAEALKAPALLAATFGDEWSAEHFTKAGPYLARNLILASQHNPWLRQQLEQAATGQDAMMKIVSLVGVGGALVTYIVPPVIWWLNLPVPDKTRELFGIPDRRERKPAYASSNGRPEAPEGPAVPEGAPGAFGAAPGAPAPGADPIY